MCCTPSISIVTQSLSMELILPPEMRHSSRQRGGAQRQQRRRDGDGHPGSIAHMPLVPARLGVVRDAWARRRGPLFVC
jgi:hypothetical protein